MDNEEKKQTDNVGDNVDGGVDVQEMKIGQDGAYQEFDVEDLSKLIGKLKEKKPLFVKHTVLKCGRLELSDPDHVVAFYKAVLHVLEREDVKELDERQVGFLVFREIFEKGLVCFGTE